MFVKCNNCGETKKIGDDSCSGGIIDDGDGTKEHSSDCYGNHTCENGDMGAWVA